MAVLINVLQQLTAALWEILVGVVLIMLQKYFDDRQ